MDTVLQLEHVGYHYKGSQKQVLRDVSLTFSSGKIYAIVGKSGAGKTTLLSLMSGLTVPTEGTIFCSGADMTKTDRYHLRSRELGVIFQSFNLLPHLTAAENVILSMDISGKRYPDKKARALSLLQKVGLDQNEAGRRVLKLSGGQQQRVAIARALSYDPSILLADEPTGNLDGETQKEIMRIFRMLAGEGKCIILVTHASDVAEEADTVYTLARS